MFVQDFDLLGLAKKLSSIVMYGYVLLERCCLVAVAHGTCQWRHSSKVKTNPNHTLKSGLFWLITRPKSVGGRVEGGQPAQLLF